MEERLPAGNLLLRTLIFCSDCIIDRKTAASAARSASQERWVTDAHEAPDLCEGAGDPRREQKETNPENVQPGAFH